MDAVLTMIILKDQKAPVSGKHADFTGLQQYINDLLYGDEKSRRYAIREAGNIFDVNKLFDSIKVDPTGAAYKDVTKIAAYPGGVEKDVPLTWVRVGSSWELIFGTLVPQDAYFLGDSDLSGNDGVTEYTSTFGENFMSPVSTGTFGDATGVTSHTHSTITLSFSTASRTNKATNTNNNAGGNHSHTATGGHNHGASTQRPALADYRMFKTSKEIGLPSGSICFWNDLSTTVPAGFSYISQAGYYSRIKSGGAGGTTAVSQLPHSTQGATTSTSTTHPSYSNGKTIGGTRTDGWAADGNPNHNHTINSHFHSHGFTFAYFDVVPMKANSFIGMPAGAILVYGSATPPTGWSLISTGVDNGRQIRFSSSYGATGGSTAHSHSHTVTMASRTVTDEFIRWETGSGIYLYYAAHSHANSSSSHNSTEHTPPGKKVFLIEKD
jgi:hypothetical protein